MTKSHRTHVLLTGGTIAMSDAGGGLRPSRDVSSEIESFISRIGAEGGIAVSFLRLPEAMDSAEMTPASWQLIADELCRHSNTADSFVVLHGTDTMAYSTAATAYLLSEMSQPVVFTGSQFPFGAVGGDAPSNLRGALRAARTSRAGVWLYFGGQLLAGARAVKTSTIDRVAFTDPSPRVRASGVTAAVGWSGARPFGVFDVPIVSVAPGFDVARFRAMTEPAPDALILRAYGPGNIPDRSASLAGAVGVLVDSGVPVVVASQSQQAFIELGRYGSSAGLADVGALSSLSMSLEATYAKIHFLLSQGIDSADFGRLLTTNIAGELL